MLNRYFVTASAVALIASSPALAGNPYSAPVEAPIAAPMVSSPAYSWAGGYAGVNLGYSGDEAEHPFSINDGGDVARGSLDITSSGFTGGVQAGWNFQNNGFVYGVEADYQASNVEGKASFNVAGPLVGGAISGEIGTELKSFGTIRARVGHTVTDRFFVYGTAGFAMGETESSLRVSGVPGFPNQSVKKTENGWTAGIGAEYAFTDKMSLKSEYIYTDLGTANLYAGDILGPNATLDRKFNFHTVRVGLNFHF